jgi:hypothetical protein
MKATASVISAEVYNSDNKKEVLSLDCLEIRFVLVSSFNALLQYDFETYIKTFTPMSDTRWG